MDVIPVLESTDTLERREWAICFLWIVKNCSRQRLLREWWKNDTMKNHIAFLKVLYLCVEVCKHPALNREASFIALDVIEDYMEDNIQEMLKENCEQLDSTCSQYLHSC